MTVQLRDLIGSLEARIQARTLQLLAAAEVGRAAASLLDPDELLRQVVNLITNRMGYYYSAVFTLDEVGRYAVLREASGEAGRLLKERGHKLEIGGQSMVGTATLTRQPRIALDVGVEAVRFANPFLPDTRSEIALPLVVGNHVIGALDVQSTQEAAFDETSATVLQSMADLIAVSLNNAEQFRRAELQSAAQNDLILLSRNLFSASTVETLYRTLATWIGALVPNDYLSLALHESTGPTLREYELRADVEPAVVETQRRSVVDTLAGQAFTLSRAVVSANLAQDARTMRDVAGWVQSGFRSALSVPLILGDRVLGTMNFASRSELAYPPRLIAQATQVASQVSAALENVRLNEAQQHTLEDLRLLTSRLTGEVWQDTFQRTPDDGYKVQFVRNGVRELEQNWLPEIELAVAQRKSVAWSQRAEQSISSPFFSAMAAPIMLGGEVIGALQVGEANQPRSWTVEDLAFIQAVADQVALAVENARLSEETQRAARRDKAIAEASDHIHRHTELESILRAAIDEVSRITGVTEVSIRLGDWSAPDGNGNQSDGA
jgi:GAF domain-containing protein